MKLIVFAIPDSVASEEIIKVLNWKAKKLGFTTNVHVIEKCDLNITEDLQTNPIIEIIEKILEICGNPLNRLRFTTNFYRAINEGFGTTKKDTKILLNEIIQGRKEDNVILFCKQNNIEYIFDLAEQTLGILR